MFDWKGKYSTLQELLNWFVLCTERLQFSFHFALRSLTYINFYWLFFQAYPADNIASTALMLEICEETHSSATVRTSGWWRGWKTPTPQWRMSSALAPATWRTSGSTTFPFHQAGASPQVHTLERRSGGGVWNDREKKDHWKSLKTSK